MSPSAGVGVGRGTPTHKSVIPGTRAVTPDARSDGRPRDRAHPELRIARAAALAIVLGLALILAWGFPYYTASFARRVRDPHHAWLRPSGPLGQSLGLLALGLFLFLWLYPLRKRLGKRPALGSLSRWLDVHIVAGMLVPAVAAVHAGMRFEGLIGLGYLSMFIVCLSGFVGRYLYVHIPRTRNGVAMSLEEVSAQATQAAGAMTVLLKDAIVSEPRADHRRHARVHPRRPVRQHRARLQFGACHQAR